MGLVLGLELSRMFKLFSSCPQNAYEEGRLAFFTKGLTPEYGLILYKPFSKSLQDFTEGWIDAQEGTVQLGLH